MNPQGGVGRARRNLGLGPETAFLAALAGDAGTDATGDTGTDAIGDASSSGDAR